MISQKLWESNLDLAEACLNCDFVKELAQRSLNEDAFKRYVAQDAFFLRAFLKAYAVSAAKCENLDHVTIFHELISGVLEELKLHQTYAQKLEIDLEQVDPFPETLSYTDFLQRKAWHSGVDEIAAAMVPCMKLYAWLGEQLKPKATSDNPYQDWITTYSSQEFQDFATQLEQLLDSVAEITLPVQEAYRYAMHCELNFFEAPLKSET